MWVGKLNFCQYFLLGFILNVYLFWMLASCGILNMYLGQIFTSSCIVYRICIVCVHQVFNKMPLWYFFIVLDSIEYQFLEITIIIHVYHALIIDCIFYTLCPISACSCISHASYMHNRCTIDAHILSLYMFCIHSCQLSLFRPFSTYNMFLCLCHALVYTMFHHPYYAIFSLCFVALCF